MSNTAVIIWKSISIAIIRAPKTTAVISIEWKQELLNVNLDLAMMLKMMEIEGLTCEDVQKYSEQGKPIPYKKVVLNLFTDDGKPGQYYTDESFCEDDDPTVFYVEIKA